MSNTTQIMKSLSQALDMPPLTVDAIVPSLPAIIEPAGEIELTKQEKESEEDFEMLRKAQREVIEQGLEALQGAMAVATGSQQPRAFEVVSKMLKDLSDANQSLLALHESRRALAPSKESEKTGAANTINNTIIVSSPAELLDMVYQKRKLQSALDNGSETDKSN